MKKYWITLTSALLLLAIMLSTTACLKPVTGDTVEGDVVQISDKLSSVTAYEVETVGEITQVGQPMTDGTCNFFYFKLGESKNVPIYYENGFHHNGTTDSVYEWKTTTISSETYENSKKASVINSTNAEKEQKVTTTVESSVSASYSGVSATVSSQISAGLSSKVSVSHTELDEKSFTQSVNDVFETSKSRVVKIPKDSPKGFYRYVLYGSFDVYAVVVANIRQQTVTYSYTSVPRADSIYDTFRYSEKDDFKATGPETRLAFSEEALRSIAGDLFAANLPDKMPGFVYASYSYSNPADRTITQVGYYGTAQTEKGDELDLSSMRAYMTDEYTFVFKVKAGAKYKKVIGLFKYDGYHEVHLYNRKNASFDAVLDEELAAEYGWLGEHVWTGDNEYEDMEWQVSGSKCAEKMYLMYDAHGEGEDTWILFDLHVVVEVIKK